MNSDFYKRIKTSLAAERLEAYSAEDGATDLITLARYILNMALCESLYSTLQIVEIALRNAIHEAIAKKVGSEDWFDKVTLEEWQQEKIYEVKKVLKQEGKEETPGRIVAGLSFGFWTCFFNKAHMRSGLQSTILTSAFPAAPEEYKNIKKMAGRWHEIRDFRNSVFHHERIVHWRDLEKRHKKLLATIGWMSPELEEMANVLDKFPKTRKAGLVPWIKKIRKHWPNRQNSIFVWLNNLTGQIKALFSK